MELRNVPRQENHIFVQDFYYCEHDMEAQWCIPLAVKPEQSHEIGLILSWAPPLVCHDMGSQT